MKKYLKILSLKSKHNISILFIKNVFEYGVYFILLNTLFNNLKYFSAFSTSQINIIVAIYVLILFVYKFFYETAQIFRYLVITSNFDLELLKPINPLFTILTSALDFPNLIIGISFLATVMYLNLSQNIILVISFLIFSISVFISVLSLLLITYGKFSFEKILLILFLGGFIWDKNASGAILTFLFSVFLLFFSIKFWNFALTKYTNASS